MAAAAPGAASAGINPTVDCFGNASGGARTTHEIGEPEADGYCTPRAGGPESFSIRVSADPDSGSVAVRGAGTDSPYLVYTAGSAGFDGYSFYAIDGNGAQISNSVTVLTDNVAATNGAPTCFGPQSGDGDAFAIGSEHFAAFCSDDEGESGPVSISIVQRPSRGELRIDTSDPSGPQLFYRATCSGPDDYSFTASDGVNTSQIYSASVTNGGAVACGASTLAPAPAAPKAPAPAAGFSLKSVPSSATVDSSGNVTIPVSGTPGSKGSVSLSAAAPKASAASVAKKKKRVKKAKPLSLGSQRFTVPASGMAKVKVKVSGKGLRALKKAKKLTATVTVKTDKATVTKKLTLKAPKAKAKKKSKK